MHLQLLLDFMTRFCPIEHTIGFLRPFILLNMTEAGIPNTSETCLYVLLPEVIAKIAFSRSIVYTGDFFFLM
jgi:hypothetical protein